MKTQNRFYGLVLMVILAISISSCSKEETAPPPDQIVDTDQDGIADASDDCPNEAGPVSNSGCPVNEVGEIVVTTGVPEEDIETYKGAIGIVVDGRNIGRKGYTPKNVMITVDATSGNYSKDVELDQYSLLGQISLEIEDLSDEAIKELTDGVNVAVEFFDDLGNSIVNESLSRLSFRSNPEPIEVRANNLEDLDTSIELNPNTPYFIQLVEEDGTPLKRVISKRSTSNEYNDVISTTVDVEFTGDEDGLLFYFEQDENQNRFQIKHKGTNTYLRRRTINNETLMQAGFGTSGFLSSRFILEKVEDGIYLLQDNLGNTFKKLPAGVGIPENDTEGEDIYVRLIPMNIKWEIEPISAEYLKPILPPAKNGFSINSTLINCGQGELKQKVGESTSIAISTAVGWEETVSISSSHSAGGEYTLGLDVEASFFGNGATYSAEAKANHNYTTTSATDTSNWVDYSTTQSQEVFSDREVTVLPKTASLVFDGYQTYDNVKMNFVERLRIKASEFDTGDILSGKQISTQFHFNGFDGVITDVGADFIEVTIRAVATLDNIYDKKSEVQDVDPNCDN